MNEEENQVGPLVGWVICRLKEESNENQKGSSLSNRIVDLTFGSLSRGDFPPTTSWIFLAKEKHLSIVAHHFTNEQIRAASEAQIKVKRFRRKNDAYGMEFTVDDTIRGVIVSDCPIQELNGSYLEQGSHNGVPKYVHVRKWCILRMELPELPELGISAADTLRMEQNGENSTFFYSKADDSFARIVDPSYNIREGGSEFTRLYIDIARAGNKMVIEDQTLLKLHDNQIRSSLQDKNSSHLLKMLANCGVDQKQMENNLQINSLENGESQNTQISLLSGSILVEDNNRQTFTANDMQASGTSYDDRTLLTEQILTKNITHQQKPFYDSSNEDPYSQDIVQGSDEFVYEAEAEIANEVVSAIIAREEAVSNLIALAVKENTRYLNEEVSETTCFESLCEPFQKVRDSTLAYFHSFSVWQRLRKRRKHREQYFETKTNSIAFDNIKDSRSFSVVIAYNSAIDLYGSSEAVKSTVSKKFSRNFEPAVKKKELKFVGEFTTREAAIIALENALQQIPQEQWLQADLEAHSKAIISFRPCKKHYLVRTSGVDSNMPCELCAATKATKKVATIAGSDTETLAFPWRSMDYNMKVQQDLSSLDQLEVFVKFRKSRISLGQSNLRLTYNPLLLDDIFLANAGRVLRSSHGRMLISELDKVDTFSNTATLRSLSGTYRPNISYSAPSGPIQASKGKIELLHDALAFSRTYQQKEKEKAKLQPYLTLPYNKSHARREYEESIQDKKQRVKHLRLRQEAESIQDDMIKLQMDLASLSIPAPSELLKRVLQTIPMAYDVAKISTINFSASDDHENKEQSKDSSHISKNLELQRSPSAPVVTTTQQLNNIVSLNNTSTFSTSSRSASTLHPKDSTQNPTNETQTKQVMAEIVELGATMTITQDRLPPAYREEDKFCRTDIGEWMGMTTGRAVRSFNFHDNLLKEGKEKEKMRKQLQLQLRRAISSDKSIVNCNVAEIEDLIRSARAVRGSVLHLDIINAENYLRRRAELISWSNHMQCIFRGNKDRKLFREMRTARIEGHRKKVALSQYAAEWSTIIALDVLQQGVKTETKRRLQDRFRCVVNLSGILAVATVVRASRAFRGPLESETLCHSCASTNLPGKRSARYEVYQWKRKEREDDAAMAGAGRVPTAKKTSTVTTSTSPIVTETSNGLEKSFGCTKTNFKKVSKVQETDENIAESTGQFTNDHSEYRFPSRLACTCPVLEESERWHVRFYFPLSCAEDVREFSVEQILDTLGQLQAAFDLYRQEFQKQQLFEHNRMHGRHSIAVSARTSLSKSSNNIQRESVVEDKMTSVESDFRALKKVFRPLLDSKFNPADMNGNDPNVDVEDLSEAADETSWTKAFVRAGNESAAALRLMTSGPLPLSVSAILQGGNSTLPDQKLLLDAQYERGHSILPDYHCLNISDENKVLTANSAWQPFHRLDVARVRYNNAKHKQRLILQAKVDVASNMKKVEEELGLKILVCEQESMAYEDKLAKYCRLREDHDRECRHNAYVMAKSKELFESVDAMEKQIKIDDLRSYDNLESGSLWKTMHRKGEIEQELVKLMPTIHEASINKAKIANQCFQILNKLKTCQLDVIQQDAAEQNIAEEIFSCEANLKQAILELSMTSKQFVRSFSKPRRLRISYVELLRDRSSQYDETGRISTRDRSLPNDRRLQILPHNLVLVRDENLRLKQENRKLLSGLYRRIISIYPLKHQDYLFADSNIRCSRCLVSCFVDDLTGTMVIHLTDYSLYQRELPGVETAEATQHEDFQLDSIVFSPLATATQRYEISLSNEEVTYIISKYALESKNASKLTKDEIDSSTVSQGSTLGVALMTTSCIRSISYQTYPLNLLPETAIRTGSISKNYYLQRFEHRERAIVENAEILVSLLRLQPFTNRPCLGNLAFYRRLKHISCSIQQCAWYRDLLSSQPSSVATTQTSKPIFITFVHVGPQQRLLCKIWQHLNKFELHFVQLECNLSLHRITRIELSALQILQRLRFSPVDTCAWIGMMTLNRYDISTVFDCLISALIPRLPGMIHWRSKLSTEVPVISFEGLTLRQSSRLSERMFRRVTSCHRFVSGKFCLVVCEVSGEIRASGLHSQNWSLSISLHPTIDDKFANHRYCEAEPLVVTMSYQELVAFLLQQIQVLVKLHSQTLLLGAQQAFASTAKKQKRKILAAVTNQVINATQKCFSLLHPLYFDKLFNHLLDCMDFAALIMLTKNKNENKLLVIPVGSLRLLPGDFTDTFLQDHRIECNVHEDFKDDIMNEAFSCKQNEDESYSRALHCGLEIDPIALSAFMKRSFDQHIEFIQSHFPTRSKELGLDILKEMTNEIQENAQFQDFPVESKKNATIQDIEAPVKPQKFNSDILERRKVVDAAALLNVVSWPLNSMAALTTPVKREKDLIHAFLTIEKANITLMRESVFVTEKTRRKSVALFDVPQTITSIPIGEATAEEAQASTNTGQQLVLHSILWKFPHHADLTLNADESRSHDSHDDSENSILTRVTIRSTPTLGAVWIDVETALQTEMEPEIAKREIRTMQYEDIRSEKLRKYFESSIDDTNMSQSHNSESNSCYSLINELLQRNIWLDAALRANIRRQNDQRLETIAAFVLKSFRLFRLDSFNFLSTEEQSEDSETYETSRGLMVHILPLKENLSERCVAALSRKMFIPVSHRQHHYNESNSKLASVVIPSLVYRDHTIWQRSSLGLISRNIYLREKCNIHLDENNIIATDMVDVMNMTSKSVFGPITWRWQQDVRAITNIYHRSFCIHHVEVILLHEHSVEVSNNDIPDSQSFLWSINLKMIDLSSEDSWTIVLTVPIHSSAVSAKQNWYNSSLESFVLGQVREELFLKCSSQLLYSKVVLALKRFLDPPLEVKSVSLPISSNIVETKNSVGSNASSSEMSFEEIAHNADTNSNRAINADGSSPINISYGSAVDEISFSSLSVQPTLRFDSVTDEIENKIGSNGLVEFDLNMFLKCHRQYFWGSQRSATKKSQGLFCSPQCETSISQRVETFENDVPSMEAVSTKNRKNIRRSALVSSPQKSINTKIKELMTEEERQQQEKQTLQELSDLEDLYDVPWQKSYILPGQKHFSKKCKLVVVLLPRDLINEHSVKFIRGQVMQKKVFKFLCQLNKSENQIINFGDWEKDILTGLIVYSHKSDESITDTQDVSKLTTLARRLLLRQQRRINERFISIISRIPNALQQLEPARIEQLARRPGILLVQRNVRSVEDREQLLSALNSSLSVLAVTQENRRRSAGRERECLLQHQRLLRAVCRKLGDLLHDAIQVVFDSTLQSPCRLNAKHIDSRRYRLAVQLLQTCEESLMAHRAKRIDKNLERHLTYVRSKNVEIQDMLDLEDIFRRVIDLDFHLSHISQDRQIQLDKKEIIASLLLEYPGEDIVDDILEPFSVANLAETELADSEETRTSTELVQILDAEDCLYLIEKILTKETNSDLSDDLIAQEKPVTSANKIIDSKRLSTKELSWLRLCLHPLHVLSALISSHCCGLDKSDSISRSPCELPLAQCHFPGCRSCRVSSRIRSEAESQGIETLIHSEQCHDSEYRCWQEQFIQPWLISIVDACATTHQMKVHWTSGLLPPSMKLDLHDITHSKEPALTINREKMLEEVAKRHILRELDHKLYLRRQYRDTLLTTQCFIALRCVLSDVCLLPVIDLEDRKRSKILKAMMLKDNGRTSAAIQWLSISSLRTLGGRFGQRILNNLRLLLRFLYQASQNDFDSAANGSGLRSMWEDLRKAFSLIFPNKMQQIQLDAVGGIFGIDTKVSSILHKLVVDINPVEEIHSMRKVGANNLQKVSRIMEGKESVEAKMRKSQTFLRTSISQKQYGMEANEHYSHPFEYSRSMNQENSDALNVSSRNDENSSLKIICDSERLPVEHIQAILFADERNIGKDKMEFSESMVYSNPGFCFLLLPLLRLSPKDLKQRNVSGGSEEASINQSESPANYDIGSEEQKDLSLGKFKETALEEFADLDLGRRSRMLPSPSLKERFLIPPLIHGDAEKSASFSSNCHSQFQKTFRRNKDMDCFVSMDRLLYEGSFFYSNFEKTAGLGTLSEIVMIAQICFGRFPKRMADDSAEKDDPPLVLSQVERDEINEGSFHIGGKIVSDSDLLSGRLQMGSERFVSLTDSLLLLDGITVTIYETHSQVHSKPIGIDGACLQRFVVQHNQKWLRTNINKEILSFDSYRIAAELLFTNLPKILQCTFIHGRCIAMSINLDTMDEIASSSALSNESSSSSIENFSSIEVKKRIGDNFAITVPNRSLNATRKYFDMFINNQS